MSTWQIYTFVFRTCKVLYWATAATHQHVIHSHFGNLQLLRRHNIRIYSFVRKIFIVIWVWYQKKLFLFFFFITAPQVERKWLLGCRWQLQYKCKVTDEGGRKFRPAHNRPLSRSTRVTHFQVDGEQAARAQLLTKRNPLTTQCGNLARRWAEYLSLCLFIKCWKLIILKQKFTESHHLTLFETINNAQKSWIQQVYRLPNVHNHICNNYMNHLADSLV